MSIDNPTAVLIFCHFQIELGFNIRGSSLIFKARYSIRNALPIQCPICHCDMLVTEYRYKSYCQGVDLTPFPFLTLFPFPLNLRRDVRTSVASRFPVMPASRSRSMVSI